MTIRFLSIFVLALMLAAHPAGAQQITAQPMQKAPPMKTQQTIQAQPASVAPAQPAPPVQAEPTLAPQTQAAPGQQQRLDVCTPNGLTRDADSLSPEQKKELAVMCTVYFYGAFLCAPVKSTLEIIGTYGKLYGLDSKDIDPMFARDGAFGAHVKANGDQAAAMGQANIQKRLDFWSQLSSNYFTKTLDEGKKLTGPILLAYIRGPEFAQFCPHVRP